MVWTRAPGVLDHSTHAAGMHPSPFGTVALIAAGAVLLSVTVVSAQSVWAAGDLGIDFVFYREVGARFLSDGSYYQSHQLAGPYTVSLMVDVLYPPPALFLFVPIALVPAPMAIVAWWGAPLLLLTYVIVTYRPATLAVIVILLLLSWPRAIGAYLFGNTDIWAVAGLAAGLRWGWPALLVALKPTFLPFALVGIRHRSFWILGAALSIASILMLPMWLDYVAVLRHLSIGGDYALGSVPLMLVPIVARLGAQTAAATSDGRTAAAPSS